MTSEEIIEGGRALGYLPKLGEGNGGTYHLNPFQLMDIADWHASRLPAKTGYELDAVEWRRP